MPCAALLVYLSVRSILQQSASVFECFHCVLQVYTAGFYQGVMLVGKYAGKKVRSIIVFMLKMGSRARRRISFCCELRAIVGGI